jgi:hypothetical protein
MKLTILIIISFLFVQENIFGHDKWLANPIIISDSINEIVPEGKCKITGIVVDQSDRLIPNFNIVTAGGAMQKINWNNSGYFEILIDTSIHSITFSEPTHGTVNFNVTQFESQHDMHIEVTLTKTHIQPDFIENDNKIMTFKPVIYLYSESLITANLQLNPSGKFTFTYPIIENNSWKLKVSEKGISHIGKTYPYLFYETENEDMNFSYTERELTGHVSSKDEVIPYLERSLTEMGLTQKEQTDFITFWAPRMVQNEQVFIQFWIDEDYDQVATLSITPQPESMKRIYIVYAPIVNNVPVYKEQTFESFTRKGFTVIEWGGSELPTYKLDFKL